MKKQMLILLLLLASLAAYPQKRYVIKTTDTISIGTYGVYKGWNYYKRYKRYWIAYPGANAKPLKDIALPIRKGYFKPEQL